MDRNNPRPCIPLYCSQPTQTQAESDCEAEPESSDFPPIRIGKSMSPASAVRRNRHHDRLSLSNQTQAEIHCEAESESSDFPPIRIGKSMSPASAMRRNPHHDQLSSSNEEPPRSRRRQQRTTTGLGGINILNIVDATAPPAMQHRKVTLYTLCR